MFKKRISLVEVLLISVMLFFICQVAYAYSNLWVDNDARVDGSVDTMDTVDTIINTLSLDIHERLLSTNAEEPKMGSNWTAAGVVCADLGEVTTVDLNGGTMDGVQIGGTTATGELIVNDSSDDADGLGTQGTSGMFLQSAGAGVNPIFAKVDMADTNDITGTLAVGNGGTGATAAANGANGVAVLGGDGYLANALVDTTALKTAQGEISLGAAGTATLPGGEYGFYPRVKGSSGTAGGTFSIMGLPGVTRQNPGTSYITNIYGHVDEATIFAQQRYITSSGLDCWIFLLVDESTKDILQAYQALDHPAYGNGGDFSRLPHPFPDYDSSKHWIILVEKESTERLKVKAKEVEKSLLTLINEDYKVDFSTVESYVSLHSGQFLGQKPVLIESIPDYISVRKLTKLTQEEKDTKEMLREAHKIANEEKKEAKKNAKYNAKIKLKALGLTQEEVDALAGE